MSIQLLNKYDKMEQVALHVPDIEAKIVELSRIGLDDWKRDKVVAKGFVFGEPVEPSIAHLAFNYQLGYEFELLSYQVGNNWHAARGKNLNVPFMSHKGFHCENIEQEKLFLQEQGIKIAQELFTLQHTNEYVISKNRTYHYCVFDTLDIFGFDLKLIQRINHGVEDGQASS